MGKYFLSGKEMQKIEDHYHKFFTEAGAKDSEVVMHEIVSDDMHIDLVHYLPTEIFPYNIIATVGMSGYEMQNVPFKRVELIMFLPKDWKLDEESFKDENWYWPIRMLKECARLPYLNNTALSIFHTFSYDAEYKPFAESTDMSVGFLTFPTWLNHDIFSLKYGFLKKKEINFLCLTAITKDELDKLQEYDVDIFMYKFLNKDGLDDLEVRNKR